MVIEPLWVQAVSCDSTGSCDAATDAVNSVVVPPKWKKKFVMPAFLIWSMSTNFCEFLLAMLGTGNCKQHWCWNCFGVKGVEFTLNPEYVASALEG